MANANTPYISKNAAPLVNPTAASVFLAVVPVSPSVITPQAAFTKYEGFASPSGAGTSNNLNLVNIKITAAGRVVGGTTTNFTPAIVFGKNTTAASNANVIALTATAFNSVSGNWKLEATMVWDPFSGQINGVAKGFAGSGGTQTTMAEVAITPITGQTIAAPASTAAGVYSSGDQTLFFSVTGMFSASNAGNIAYLDQFQSEEL